MKIKKFNEKFNEHDEYYIVVAMSGNQEYIIKGEENYEFNYDPQDIKSVVEFVIKERKELINTKLKIRKIKEEDVSEKTINKIAKEIEIENNSEKYNL